MSESGRKREYGMNEGNREKMKEEGEKGRGREEKEERRLKEEEQALRPSARPPDKYINSARAKQTEPM